MRFSSQAKENFQIEFIDSSITKTVLNQCSNIYSGMPYWLDKDNHIKTVNFAKTICSETARLATLDISITVDGSLRADWLQKKINGVHNNLRAWVEYGCAYGVIILKPNGKNVDIVTPDCFEITDIDNGKIMGVVFENQKYDNRNKKWYTRLEWHRFDGNTYLVSNKCYVSDSQNGTGKPLAIELTPWAGMEEEIAIEGLESPLFSVFKLPAANNVDISSPLSLPIFSDAIEELKDLDIAYSRNIKEIWDSKRLTLIDSNRLMPYQRGKAINNSYDCTIAAERQGLPDYVKIIEGIEHNDIYHEINPQLNTEMRLKGINALLSQIGFKCGYSNGYFVFNEKTGMVTATQVEADDRRTIQLIKDVRDMLRICINDLIYALSKFEDLYGVTPAGNYEVVYKFQDITYSYEEDKARWYAYATSGKVPFWLYLTKFEGYSESEAKEIEAETKQNVDLALFGQEE